MWCFRNRGRRRLPLVPGQLLRELRFGALDGPHLTTLGTLPLAYGGFGLVLGVLADGGDWLPVELGLRWEFENLQVMAGLHVRLGPALTLTPRLGWAEMGEVSGPTVGAGLRWQPPAG